MTRGRRPDPAAVQQAKGNPRKRGRRQLDAMRRAEEGDAPVDPAAPNDQALPADAAHTEAASPAEASAAAPVELDEGAKAIWLAQAPELIRLRFLRATDVEPFKRYCVNLARWWRNQNKLADMDVTYETQSAHGNLQRIHPLFIVQMHLEKRLTDFEDRFGLNPAARQRIIQTAAARQPFLPGFNPTKSNDGASEGAADSGAEAPAPTPQGGRAIGFLNPSRLN